MNGSIIAARPASVKAGRQGKKAGESDDRRSQCQFGSALAAAIFFLCIFIGHYQITADAAPYTFKTKWFL